MKKNALLLLHPDCEEIEAVTPIDLLTRAGVRVEQVATAGQRLVTGRSGITLVADCLLDEVIDRDYDAVIIPGGPGIQQLRKNPAIVALLQRQFARNKTIGCICAAPLLLLDAELIKGIVYTAYPATASELPYAQDEAVVIDGPIITSRGAGTAIEFALALVSRLTDKTTAKVIADSILWPRSEFNRSMM